MSLIICVKKKKKHKFVIFYQTQSDRFKKSVRFSFVN